jgi:hypothetical protein
MVNKAIAGLNEWICSDTIPDVLRDFLDSVCSPVYFVNVLYDPHLAQIFEADQFDRPTLAALRSHVFFESMYVNLISSYGPI